MGLDDLIRIILVFAFFVLPIFRRLSGGSRRQQPKPKTGIPKQQPQQTRGIPTPTQTPTQGRAAQAEARSNRSAERPTASGSASAGQGDFSKRLEEARRRVREAVETQTTGQVGGAPTRPTPAPRTSPVSQQAGAPARQPVAREANELFGPRDGKPQTAIKAADSAYANRSPAAFLPSESVTATASFGGGLTAESKPLQVERRRSKKYAKLDASPLLKLDDKSIMSGFIWHQILGEPRSKQRRRTKS